MTTTIGGYSEKETIEIFLEGLQARRARMKQAVQDIERQLNPDPQDTAHAEAEAPIETHRTPHRHMSAAGREAIRAATKRRWAKYRREQRALAKR